MKTKTLELLKFLTSPSNKVSYESKDTIALNQAIELLKNGHLYANKEGVAIKLKSDFTKDFIGAEGNVIPHRTSEEYKIKVYKDDVSLEVDHKEFINKNYSESFTYRHIPKENISERVYFSKELNRQLTEQQGPDVYLERIYSFLHSPYHQQLSTKKGYLPPFFKIEAYSIHRGLIPKTDASPFQYQVPYYPALNPENFALNQLQIPDTYLGNKPDGFEAQASFPDFIQLLNEAAALDDIDGICELWNSVIKVKGYSQTNMSFPGILLASCRIVDELGGNGSEWYNVGVIQTKTLRTVVLMVDGFAGKYSEVLFSVNAAEMIDLNEALNSFKKEYNYRVNEFDGLDPYERIHVDMRRNVYKSLIK